MATVNLVNMKIDPKEREKAYAPSTVAADAPQYPYGLNLHLDDEVIAKLGSGVIPGEVGGTVMVVAKAKVTSISSHEGEGTKKHKSVALQITDLGLQEPEADKNAADVLYAKG